MTEDTALPDPDVESDVAAPTVADLKEVSALARRQLELEDEIATLEDALKLKNEALRAIAEGSLPTTLDEIGLADSALSDGSSIAVRKSYHASISKANLPRALPWLESKGHGDLAKTEVKVGFGRGDDEKVAALLQWVKTTFPKIKVASSQSIHSGTLSAFVREQIEAGEELPLDLLGVHVARKAAITRPAKPTEDKPL